MERRKLGINKVNVNTDLQFGSLEYLRKHVEENEPSGFQMAIANGYQDVLKNIWKYVDVLGKLG